jgi:hypothetical protein
MVLPGDWLVSSVLFFCLFCRMYHRQVWRQQRQLQWQWQPPNFLSVTCCREAFPSLEVQGIEGWSLVGALFPLQHKAATRKLLWREAKQGMWGLRQSLETPRQWWATHACWLPCLEDWVHKGAKDRAEWGKEVGSMWSPSPNLPQLPHQWSFSTIQGTSPEIIFICFFFCMYLSVLG